MGFILNIRARRFNIKSWNRRASAGHRASFCSPGRFGLRPSIREAVGGRLLAHPPSFPATSQVPGAFPATRSSLVAREGRWRHSAVRYTPGTLFSASWHLFIRPPLFAYSKRGPGTLPARRMSLAAREDRWCRAAVRYPPGTLSVVDDHCIPFVRTSARPQFSSGTA
jgi:hypothetical protein